MQTKERWKQSERKARKKSEWDIVNNREGWKTCLSSRDKVSEKEILKEERKMWKNDMVKK